MTRLTLALIALAAAGSANAACIYPRAPDRLPDGSTATYEEMVAGQKAVQQFNEDINAYNACLDLEMVTLEKSGSYAENRLTELRAIVGALQGRTPISQPAVAQHLNVLRTAGLVSGRAAGTRRLVATRG